MLSEMVLIYIKSKPSVYLLVTFIICPRAFESRIHFEEKLSLFFRELLSLTESEYRVSNVTKESLNHLTQIQ